MRRYLPVSVLSINTHYLLNPHLTNKRLRPLRHSRRSINRQITSASMHGGHMHHRRHVRRNRRHVHNIPRSPLAARHVRKRNNSHVNHGSMHNQHNYTIISLQNTNRQGLNLKNNLLRKLMSPDRIRQRRSRVRPMRTRSVNPLMTRTIRIQNRHRRMQRDNRRSRKARGVIIRQRSRRYSRSSTYPNSKNRMIRSRASLYNRSTLTFLTAITSMQPRLKRSRRASVNPTSALGRRETRI